MIINSLLDTDLYKFTMQQAVMHQFPNAHEVEFHFKCRNEGVNLVNFIDEINKEIDHLCTLRFAQEELDYLSTQPYIKSDYVDFLSIFQLQRRFINVIQLNENEIDIVIKGPWIHTILFEVPALAIVNEVYFKSTDLLLEGRKRLDNKILQIFNKTDKYFKFSEFGTRRRYSRSWQEFVVYSLNYQLPNNFIGTSNVFLAKKYNLTPIGTMAHEYLQACQSIGPSLRNSQIFALDTWVHEYRGELGIALTDVIGIDAFLRDFDGYFARIYDGLRHDSGDPIEWGWKVIKHYQKLGIDPLSKTLVFSDGLTTEEAIKIYNEFKGWVGLSFGIGTHFTNDMGIKALNIIIKMTSCNGSPVAKISDSSGKTMCMDEDYLKYLKKTFSK